MMKSFVATKRVIYEESQGNWFLQISERGLDMGSRRSFLRKIAVVCLMFLFVFSAMPQVAYGIAYDPEKDYENLGIRFWEDEKPGIGFYINASARYILETVTEPDVGTISGEWSVMDLLRGMYTGYDYINYIPEDYFKDYINRVEQYVAKRNGNLDRNKITEWARLTLSLTALGYDISDVAGHDFIERFSKSHRFSYRQGINGPIWTLIALNTGGYKLYENPNNPDANTEGKMLDYILDREIVQTDGTVGGWALMGDKPDPDITGMALQALAPYYLDEARYERTGASVPYEEFVKKVERAIYVLSLIQRENGAFAAFGNVNAESTVQVIVALTALGIDPLAESIRLPHIGKTVNFITEGAVQDGVWTNDMISALLTFWANGSGSSPEVGGFKHVTTGYDGGGGSGHGVNGMATDQALYGLIAYDRFLKGENPLYDMSDMQNGEYRNMTAKTYNVTFVKNGDVTNDAASPYALIEIPSGAEVDGKTFTHWNTKADGSGTKYDPGEQLVMPEHDITLYAQYETIKYKIEFHTNGGEFIRSDIPETYTVDDGDIELPTEDDLAYEGHRFAGWYDNPDFEGEPLTVIPSGSTGDKVLYAKWEGIDETDGIVEMIIALIDALPDVEGVTLSDKEKIESIRQRINQLDPTKQQLIVNIDKLEALETRIAELEKAEEEMDAVEKVESLIANLPDPEQLTLEDKARVEDVRQAFYSLAASKQNQVANIERFRAIETKMFELLGFTEDEAEANRVEMMIAGLPDADEITLNDEESVAHVRDHVDRLTEEQQALVMNIAKLEALENKLTELKQVALDEEAALAVVEMILQLPHLDELELADRLAVEAARSAYEELTAAQQALVVNLSHLEALEQKLVELEQAQVDREAATEVEEMIDRLPTVEDVELSDLALVEAARAAYDALTESQQSLVANLSKLEALEEKLQELVKEGDDKNEEEKESTKKRKGSEEELDDENAKNNGSGSQIADATKSIENGDGTGTEKSETGGVPSAEPVHTDEVSQEGDGKLPVTATNVFNILLLGALLMVVGTSLHLHRKRSV